MIIIEVSAFVDIVMQKMVVSNISLGTSFAIILLVTHVPRQLYVYTSNIQWSIWH